MIKRLMTVFMLFSFVVLTGCYDSHEIDESAYVVALGVDNATDGEYAYTFQISAPLAIMEGKESGKINSTVIHKTVIAPDFYSARELLDSAMSKTTELSHMKLIIFSEDVAKDGLSHHTRLLSRERQIRPNTYLAVAKTSTKEFLEAVNPDLESNTAKYYELLTLNTYNVNAPVKKIRDFVNESETLTKSSILPIGVIEGNTACFSGVAVFKDKKMTAELPKRFAMLYSILSGNAKTLCISFKDEQNETISFNVRCIKKPCFKVEESVTADIGFNISYNGPSAYSGKKLESMVAQRMKSELTSFLYLTSRTYNADILGIGNKARGKFLTTKEFENFSWQSVYPRINFNVKVNASLYEV